MRFPRDADGIGCADLREAIEDCSTDIKLCYLTLEGAGHDALTEQLEAVQFCFDQAAAMVAAPLLPNGASKPFDRTERFIAGSRPWAILLPWSTVAADRNDGLRLAFACPYDISNWETGVIPDYSKTELGPFWGPYHPSHFH